MTFPASPRAAAALVAALALTASCSTAPTVHDEMGGPLKVEGAGSGLSMSVYAPDVAPYKASFGYHVLCSNADDDVELVLGEVRWKSPVEPLAVTTMLRHVTAEQVRDRRVRGRFEPFYSVLGGAPDWDEPYVEATAPGGRFSDDVEGAVIDQSCDPPRDEVGFTELVLVVEVDARGAEIDGYSLDYTADGDPHSVEIDQTMVVCGTDTPADRCAPPKA